MTATRLTLAVGSLVSLLAHSCCDAQGIQRVHEAGTYQVRRYVPGTPGPQTGRYIAKIAAGGNQGNRMRNRQLLSKNLSSRVGRKEAREWKTIKTEQSVQRNGTDRGTKQKRNRPFLGKRCCRARKQNGPFLCVP